MKMDKFDHKQELISQLMEDLDFVKPSVTEMLTEIRDAGLVIKLENSSVSFLEKNREQVVISMWKAVRVAKMLNERDINVEFDAR